MVHRAMLRRTYDWCIAAADKPYALWILAAVAFAESSFFPVPPDIMLLPMSLARPQRAWLFAALCTVASVAGGVLGYAIGALFWETAGTWLINALHVPLAQVDALRLKYSNNAYLIMVQGATPIPYKLVTIASGLAGVTFPLFMLYSAITRSIRYLVIEALLVYYFGEKAQELLEKYLEVALVLFLVVLVLGIAAAIYL